VRRRLHEAAAVAYDRMARSLRARWDHDTWHGGRFLEEWADPGALDGLHEAFAHYEEADTRCALLTTMDLFRRIGRETAVRLGCAYPEDADQRVTA
jgi:aminoglycoside 6-adenylyltransferase